MKRVNFTYRVFDNCIEIIPESPIEDNSIYDIRFNGIKSMDGKILQNQQFKIATKMTPCYCSIDAVKILCEDFELPDSDILFFIRQASREADYINKGPVQRDRNGNVPFPVEKFVETKATIDALTKAYINGNNEAGMEGTLGQLTFKNGAQLDNLRKLLQNLKRNLARWQDAIRGYDFEGRNDMSFALRANKTRRPTPARTILSDFSRNVNQGRDYI